MDDVPTWARHALAAGELGHADRDDRAYAMLTAIARAPAGTVPAVFRVRAPRRAAYRFLQHDGFSWRDVAAAQQRATARRARVVRDDYLVGVVDGSSLAHTDKQGDDGVGPIGSYSVGGRGIKTSMALLMTAEGIELGVGALALWARPVTPLQTPHDRRALSDKESRWWIELPAATRAALDAEGVRTRLWWQFDREADMWPVLADAAASQDWVTVRQSYDRVLAARDSDRAVRSALKVDAALETTPPAGVLTLSVRPGRGRTARLARLVVTVLHVGVRLSTTWSHAHVGDVGLTVVRAREEGTCPPGEAPLDWTLWTTAPATTFAEAVRVVRTYALRFRVEGVHLGWKSGCCAAEDAQLESFEALAKWSVLLLTVAVHRESLLHRSRVEPELPADVAFDRDTINAALLLYREHRTDGPAMGTIPTLGRLVTLIAELGGYTGKSSGGPPGLKTFGRGMDHVEVAATVLRLQRRGSDPPT